MSRFVYLYNLYKNKPPAENIIPPINDPIIKPAKTPVVVFVEFVIGICVVVVVVVVFIVVFEQLDVVVSLLVVGSSP